MQSYNGDMYLPLLFTIHGLPDPREANDDESYPHYFGRL